MFIVEKLNLYSVFHFHHLDAVFDLLQQNHVHHYAIDRKAYCKGEIARLARASPSLKLESMRAEIFKILLAVESQLLLHVIPTMIVVEEQVVDG